MRPNAFRVHGKLSRESTSHTFCQILETFAKSIPYCRVNAHVHEKVLVLFQESFNATTVSCNYAILCWMFFRKYV